MKSDSGSTAVRYIYKSLAFKLFCLLLLVGAVVFVSLTALIVRANRQHIMEEIILSAHRTNELLLLSMRQSMLLNRREEVAQTIGALRSGPGIEGIRIYGQEGNIVFSTNVHEVGQKVDLTAEQCIVCHIGEKPLEYIPATAGSRVIASPKGYRVLGVVNPIRNEPACAASNCHPSPSERKILGMLDSQLNLAEVDRNIFTSRKEMIFYSIGAILVIEFFAGFFIARMVHRRVIKLAEGSRAVKSGNLDFSIHLEGNDDIADLAHSFNSIVASLKRAEAENAELSQKMVHVAKMASMGKLAATVAHEINNPLGGILTYTRLISRQMNLGPMTEDQRKGALGHLEAAIREIKRCGNIVNNLLHFSRSSESDMENVDLHNVIERSLAIINHHFQMNNVTTVINLGAGDPGFIGNANQIEQMLIALFMNAVEAMPRGGALTVATWDVPERDAVSVSVADTGRGIPPEIRSNIFEPFFTTKEKGHSIGLGLSIVYGIVLRHGGEIDLKSEPGKGTTFTMTFPRRAEPEKLQKESVLQGPVISHL